MLAVFTVTNTNSSGPGSLDNAVTQANGTPGQFDEIRFDPALSGQLIQLSGPTDPPFDAESHLKITEGVLIDASDLEEQVRIQASPGHRVFEIDAALDEVTLRHLEVTGGSPTFGFGGGIQVVTGRFTVEDSLITGNSAPSGGGVAISQFYSYSPTYVSIRRSVISDNVAHGSPTLLHDRARGGGLYVNSEAATGEVRIEDTLFIGNESFVQSRTSGKGGGGDESDISQGGGAWIYLHANELGEHTDFVMTSSTLANNETQDDGGGIYVRAKRGSDIRISNSTISGNVASADDSQGGGVYLLGAYSPGSLLATEFLNSTITNNRAAYGGGLFKSDSLPPSSTTLKNTIVASNVDHNQLPNDIVGMVNPASDHNLIGSVVFSGGLVNGANNIVGADPQLSPLGEYGGLTPTHRAFPGSLVIDAGKNGHVIDIIHDQRGDGFARIAQDHFDPTNDHVDIGAVENVLCDLDHDTDCDTDDMRRLYDEIFVGATSSLADIDANGVVDNADIDGWLDYASAFDDKIYKRGDTNFDGDVDGPDFTRLALNFGDTGLPDAYWDQGNFDGNASGGIFEVGGTDFTQLALNFGHTSPAPIAQPWSTVDVLDQDESSNKWRDSWSNARNRIEHIDAIFAEQNS